MRKIEYSQIVRRKMKELRSDLTLRHGDEFSRRTLREITTTIRKLEEYSDIGVRIAEQYELETDYYYIFKDHNYFIYRIETDKVIIANMFHEKEDFMMKLFGLSGRTQDSIDYWGE